MGVALYFGLEGFRISINEDYLGVGPLHIKFLSVMAFKAGTSLAFSIFPKTVTIQFQALAFFAIATFLPACAFLSLTIQHPQTHIFASLLRHLIFKMCFHRLL